MIDIDYKITREDLVIIIKSSLLQENGFQKRETESVYIPLKELKDALEACDAD